MNNSDVNQAWQYHNHTKHSEASIRRNIHTLDWANRPLPFKIYQTLEGIKLPVETEQTGIAALSAVSELLPTPANLAIPNLKDLSRILYFSAGITKRKRYSGGEIYFRAAACTGALYEFELYVICGDLPDLEAGVYHFGPADFSLRRLRAGDYRGTLAHATSGEESVTHAPMIIVCTGTYWRNAWKYQARTYRHFGWDNGTLLANMLAMCNALLLPARVVCGFVDSDVNALLDVDATREVAFSIASIGFAQQVATANTGMPELNLPVLPLSRSEVDYPELRLIHEASSLHSANEVATWRGRGAEHHVASTQAKLIGLERLEEGALAGDPIEQVILRRGSSRRFARLSMSLNQLSTILQCATRGIPADFLEPVGTQLNDLYLIVNAVDGLTPGAYFYHRDQNALEFLKDGQFRAEARHLGLQQDLPGDAAVAVFFLADLNPILSRFGNRGYRAVQLEAGTIGGKLYMAAYALHLGATGLTFFDDDVTNFFSPHAAGKSAIFLVALGRGVKPGV